MVKISSHCTILDKNIIQDVWLEGHKGRQTIASATKLITEVVAKESQKFGLGSVNRSKNSVSCMLHLGVWHRRVGHITYVSE